MKTRVYGFCLVVAAALVFGFIGSFSIGASPVLGQALTEQDRIRLEGEYVKLQAEIAEWQKVLDTTRTKKSTLQGDVTLLNAQIKQAEAKIRQKNLAISNLGVEIEKKSARIGALTNQIDRGRKSLAQLLRKTNQINEYSIAEILLSSEGLSDIFIDLDTFDEIKSALAELFTSIREAKGVAEKEKEELDVKKNQELDAKYVVESNKKEIARSEANKKELLEITKSEEKNYQEVLEDRQRKAEQIRTALFNLRDADGIPFGTALEYASFAAAKTGVRTALILAILSQESDLGKNVGACYVTDLTTGDGVGKNTGTRFERVMKAPRDTVPFGRIAKTLGISMLTTPVSCPLGKAYSPSRGFGGAMGPSQFIPSTWEIFEDRIKVAMGVSIANPWDAKHAIVATALYLADLGADGSSFTSERNAACRYYSGRACDNRTPVNTPYGNKVLDKAEKFQEDIDFLKGV